MAATVSTQARTRQATEFAATFDRMEIRTTGGSTVLATITLNWGTASAGAVTCDPSSVNASATGTAAEARVYNAATPTQEMTGLTVGTTGTDVVLVSTSITNTQPVDLTSVTFTAPTTA